MKRCSAATMEHCRSGVNRIAFPGALGCLPAVEPVSENHSCSWRGSTNCSWPIPFMVRADDAGAALGGPQNQLQACATAHATMALWRSARTNTSQPAPGQSIYPYLLLGLKIERSIHVWCAGIICISIGRGFLDLVAIMDWASRGVLPWRLSNTMDAAFRAGALEEALVKYGKPRFSNRPGQPVHRRGLHRRAARAGIRVSMDGRGRWMDNVFIERLWRSETRGHLSQHLSSTMPTGASQAGIFAWAGFYNTKRFHWALGNRTPMAVWRDGAAAVVDAAGGYGDNAYASPTDRQQQQDTEPLAARSGEKRTVRISSGELPAAGPHDGFHLSNRRPPSAPAARHAPCCTYRAKVESHPL